MMAARDCKHRLQACIRQSLEIMLKPLRVTATSFVILGAYMFLILLEKDNIRKRRDDAQQSNDDTPQSNPESTASPPNERSYLVRTLERLVNNLRGLFRPTSFYVPIWGSTLGLLYGFRAMEGHHLALPATEKYFNACPQDSRQTTTEVLVKLFAATVTTVGVHGHLNSLNGSRFWRRELFHALEVCFNPLASVLSFITAIWYGFIDLLLFSAGPWKEDTGFLYRLGRLCGCYVSTGVLPTADLSFLQLGFVNPQHVVATSLKRDLTWGSRVVVLIILFGQYSQAAVLLTRRILSNTAGWIDYAMVFFILSGLAALIRSIAISLLNVSWTLEEEFRPCKEGLCSLPACIEFRTRLGLPCKASYTNSANRSLAFVSQILRYQLAGGLLQGLILWPIKTSFWQNLMFLYLLHIVWLSSVYCMALADGFWEFLTGTRKPQSPDIAQPLSDHEQTSSLPAPISHGVQNGPIKSRSIIDLLIPFAMAIHGIVILAWLCYVVVWQLLWLLAPCVGLYSMIAIEIRSWKELDSSSPCPQLWKDELGDELWWF
jgi:hypothetical protein